MLPRILGFGLVLFGAYVVIQEAKKTALVQQYSDMPAPDAAVDVLARTIWGEARGEGTAGMQAVANVIMNRAANPGWWGTDIQSVCLAPWQFSCWNPTDPNLIQLTGVDASDPQFAVALQLAQAAVAGQLPDITGGATSYYNPSLVQPSWASSMTVTAQIGSQVFGVVA